MKNYETEARERWGDTDAYREHEQKTKNYTKEKWAEVNDGMMAIFAEFEACKQNGAKADSVEAQELVAKFQAHITENYYTCTDEILAVLGKVYVADEQSKKIIDGMVMKLLNLHRKQQLYFIRRNDMVKDLTHDPIFLAGKSEIATKEDLPVAQDLLDTLMAHKETCVGMAANMIGVKKRIIAFLDESGRTPVYTVMLNPEVIKKDGAYDTEEGCLSLLGAPRKCKR